MAVLAKESQISSIKNTSKAVLLEEFYSYECFVNSASVEQLYSNVLMQWTPQSPKYNKYNLQDSNETHMHTKTSTATQTLLSQMTESAICCSMCAFLVVVHQLHLFVFWVSLVFTFNGHGWHYKTTGNSAGNKRNTAWANKINRVSP